MSLSVSPAGRMPGKRHRLHLDHRQRRIVGVGVDLVNRGRREVRVGVRLQVVGAADAGVRHHRHAGAGLDAGPSVAAAAAGEEGVVAGVLVAELVGDVVDREEVALGLGEAGAAPALVVPADHAEIGDAAAVHAEADMADVIVRRRRPAGRGRSRLRPNVPTSQILDVSGGGRRHRVEARVRTARPVGAGSVGLGVEVELVLGLVDQHHLDSEVVVVDLVDAMDQRGLRSEHELSSGPKYSA